MTSKSRKKVLFERKMMYRAGTKLVKELVLPVSQEKKHVLSCFIGGKMISTTMKINRKDSSFKYEDPDVVSWLGLLTKDDESYVILLSTLLDEVAYYEESELPVHKKEIRGWICEGNKCTGLSSAQMFNAYCIDSNTGEPIPPVRGEEYKDAWDITVALSNFYKNYEA